MEFGVLMELFKSIELWVVIGGDGVGLVLSIEI